MLQHVILTFVVFILAMEAFYFIIGRKHEIEFRHKMLKLQVESILITASIFCFLGYAVWGV